MEDKGEQIGSGQGESGRISRRKFLTKVVPAAAVVTAAITTPVAAELIFGGKKENTKSLPTFEDVEKAVKDAYNQEVPEDILKKLPVCNEHTQTQDPIKEVLHSCGEVGAGIRDLAENTKDSDTRNRLILDLKTVERYTMGKIDEYAKGSKLGKLSDPENKEGFKDLFKEIYFTVRPDKP